MAETLTVSQFVETVNYGLESLGSLTVEGEVDEFKIIHQKWVTFRIKDENASVGCFMTVWQYKTQIEDGMKVRAIGKPNLRDKGFFSFVLSSVQPAGEGALKRAFELLKKKLTEEGLFSSDRKRALPRFPQHVALITSRDAAAYGDFLKVLQARQGGLTVSFLHTQVQGEPAVPMVLEALAYANTELADLDAIVMIRGGGSLEDLQAFNDEQVVRAVASSRTPTIVGIGHERDVTLAEMAADVRASTPSNAAELLVRSREELAASITNYERTLRTRLREVLREQMHGVTQAVRVLSNRVVSTTNQVTRRIDSLRSMSHRFASEVEQRKEGVVRFRQALSYSYGQEVERKKESVVQLSRMMKSLSPQETLGRGYSITRLSSGGVVKRKDQVKSGDRLITQVSDGEIESVVNGGKQQSLL